MEEIDQLEVMFLVVDLLNDMGIPYLVGGSYASSAHGISRSTRDIDLLASLRPPQVKEFVERLQVEFYADDQAISRAVAAKQHFNIIHLNTMFKIDFFPVRGRFEEVQLERRKLATIGDRAREAVYVATAEDTILAKLVWYRKGNEVSDQQWQDVRGVVRMQAEKLDVRYLKKWAHELGVADLLERLLMQS